jgi:Ser-tRNA(Ala) deacylase AlaX
MATKLLYLENFDVVTCSATVADIESTEDGRTIVKLDQTCFYPRGGGQDWDIGIIKNESVEFKVEEVRLDEKGEVQHIGTFTKSNLRSGDQVDCRVDTERRAINTRLHSAGHLIDMAMNKLKPAWVPVRGGHYPHMSFVEYQVSDEEATEEEFIRQLQSDVTKLSQSSYQNQLRFIPKEEMGQYYPHLPNNIPINKPSRIVLYADDFGIPCGGTHVKRVSEIGQVTITKVKTKKGLAKVSYAVAGIN